MTDTREPVRFYFSFRSPYSWLAMLRIEAALSDLPVRLEYLPVFPPPNFPNDPAAVPNKLKYIQLDTARIAEQYGFITQPLGAMDTNWARPHAAFLYAQDQGKGREFALDLYAARFSRGLDAGDDGVMADVAKAHGLDAKELLKAADDEGFQTRVVLGMIQGVKEDSIFGVPLFAFRGEPFWGNDRIDWLVRAIRRAHGLPVVDLKRDMLQPLDR
jgi:2-hydroxychromene-2-carboxylate isomerase